MCAAVALSFSGMRSHRTHVSSRRRIVAGPGRYSNCASEYIMFAMVCTSRSSSGSSNKRRPTTASVSSPGCSCRV